MNERLKMLRLALNLTQEEFGIRIGSARNTIANYETGNRKPKNAIISLICKEFNVNEEWLRNGTGEMFIEVSEEDEYTKAAAIIAQNNDVEIMSLLIEYWKLDNDSKEIFKNYLRNVSERINATKPKEQGTFKPITVQEIQESYSAVPDPAELEELAVDITDTNNNDKNAV